MNQINIKLGRGIKLPLKKISCSRSKAVTKRTSLVDGDTTTIRNFDDNKCVDINRKEKDRKTDDLYFRNDLKLLLFILLSLLIFSLK